MTVLQEAACIVVQESTSRNAHTVHGSSGSLYRHRNAEASASAVRKTVVGASCCLFLYLGSSLQFRNVRSVVSIFHTCSEVSPNKSSSTVQE